MNIGRQIFAFEINALCLLGKMRQFWNYHVHTSFFKNRLLALGWKESHHIHMQVNTYPGRRKYQNKGGRKWQHCITAQFICLFFRSYRRMVDQQVQEKTPKPWIQILNCAQFAFLLQLSKKMFFLSVKSIF